MNKEESRLEEELEEHLLDSLQKIYAFINELPKFHSCAEKKS